MVIREIPVKKVPPKLLKVAAYARVSSGKDAMLHSLSAQVSYYNGLIQNHPGWKLAGIYADEAKTGTKDSREDFQRMLRDCREGKINLIITKSISRFARNTVTLLDTVRDLKAIGVDIFFEEQNIHTLSDDGELIISLLSGIAQEESLSVSENQKWRIRKNFEEGIPWNGTLLGYRLADGKYVIEPNEAETVRRIYSLYLSGLGVQAIANILNEEGAATRKGEKWYDRPIMKILQNNSYTGNLLLQKTYRTDHLTKKTVPNNGDLPQYFARGTHEAIIPEEVFEAVQIEIQRRSKRKGEKKKTYPYTGLITCGCCGAHYQRKVTQTEPVWICSTFNRRGKKYCPSKQIPERALESLKLPDTVESITAENGNRLVLYYKDGHSEEKTWKDRSRAESWTDEKRAAAAERSRKRWQQI